MGLRNLPNPMKTVEVAEGVSFTVRGFSPNDALALYHRHAGILSTMFDDFVSQQKKIRGKAAEAPAVDVKELGVGLVNGAPRLLAEIIAIASGSIAPEPHMKGDELVRVESEFEADVRAALNLSAGVQVDALTKIADLSFSSDMPPGKFLTVVVQLAQSATAAMTIPASPRA